MTLTITVSSSLAYRVGPGNSPSTVTMDFVAHSFVAFFETTYIEYPVVLELYVYIYKVMKFLFEEFLLLVFLWLKIKMDF